MLYLVLLRVGAVGVAGDGGPASDGDGEAVGCCAGMISGGVGVSDGEGAGAGGSGCRSARGAGLVVCRCWVASCVDWMLARVSEVFCWVLGLLVLPTVGALRWLLALVRVPSVMYWVPLPPVSFRVILLVRVL